LALRQIYIFWFYDRLDCTSAKKADEMNTLDDLKAMLEVYGNLKRFVIWQFEKVTKTL